MPGRVKLLSKGLAINYRPITVNGCFSKVKTKLVTKQMILKTERENILQPTQFRFHQNMSTGEAIIVSNTIVSQSKLLKENLFLCFVDITDYY